MTLRVREFELGARRIDTRLPFRFGVTTLTTAPLLMLRLAVEIDGDEHRGFASDLLVPKWFSKDLAFTAEQDAAGLIASAARAADAAVNVGAVPTVFDCWREIHAARVGTQPIDAPDRLVHGFGVALVERALLDALCRARDRSFHEVIRSGDSGFELRSIHADLPSIDPSAILAETPATTLAIRHTVGLADAIRSEDIEARLDDGLPESLEEAVAAHGLTHFKIKIAGDLPADLDRLLRINDLLADRVPSYVFTLDGNEQLDSIDALRQLLDRIAGAPDGAAIRRRLLYIEQPLSRVHTFELDRLGGIDRLGVDVIIDEADASLDAFRRALACGYRGVSVKNCKGVFRAIANCALAQRRNGFQSAEDLTNVGVVPLQQDLATIASLGLDHVERNGHHYVRGLQHLPPRDQAIAIDRHGDLYEQDARIGPMLRIRDGRIRIGTLQCPGYGVAVPPDMNDWPAVSISESQTR